jgi:cyclophilin family peptidyl-prolyl cis-trans isomerase
LKAIGKLSHDNS